MNNELIINYYSLERYNNTKCAFIYNRAPKFMSQNLIGLKAKLDIHSQNWAF